MLNWYLYFIEKGAGKVHRWCPCYELWYKILPLVYIL